uniref:Uncharacterized protein n=1 Tax=Arundo donax TaxID=35708 RepID=A0A0A9GP16_ARUDO
MMLSIHILSNYNYNATQRKSGTTNEDLITDTCTPQIGHTW